MLNNNDIIHVRHDWNGTVLATIILANGSGTSRPLHHMVRHSPTGFNYGYGGSGPADLALSILVACAGHELADQYYQAFKWDRIAPEKSESWTIKVQQVREWLKHRTQAAQ